MTDYLEELLRQMEQEEEEQAAQWNPVRRSWIGVAAGRDKPGAKEKVAPGQESAERERSAAERERSAAERERGAAKRRIGAGKQAIAPEAETAENARSETGRALAEQLSKLRRAVQQMTRSEGRRGVSAAGLGMDTTASGRKNGGWTTFAAAHYAAMVDEAFQRDARRYDGPLGLL